MNPQIFKKYDIRGIFNEDFTLDDVYLIGRAFVALCKEKLKRFPVRLSVGYDARQSSPEIKETLVRAITDCGVEVYDLGLVPTPVQYFSLFTLFKEDIMTIPDFTGMRKSEILSLKWSDVDLKAGFIFLRKTKNHEPRQIPMCNTLKSIMKGLFLKRRLDTEWVFYNPLNPSQRLQDIKRAFNTACRKAGIRDFHFHDLRHTCASWLVMAGVDLRAVAEILGHKTIRMTMRYSHLSPEHLQKTVSVFDKLISTDTLTDTVSQSN